jgi:hypothetical protein
MKEIKLLFFLCFLCSFSLNAQTTKIEKNDNIYLTINKNEEYIVKNIKYKDNTIPLSKNHTFNIKRNSIDIYLNWINPLQYKLVLQDSIINDVRVEEVKKFFTENFTGLAGGSSLIRPTGRGSKIIDKCSDISGTDIVSMLFPEHYNTFAGNFTAGSDLCNIWMSTSQVMALDLSLSETNLKTKISNLYNASTVDKAKNTLKDANELLEKLSKNRNKTIAKLYDLEKRITDITVANQSALKTKLTDYNVSQNKIFANNKRLVELLKLYIIQVTTSLEKESNDFDNHYRLKTISLPKSKSVSLTLKLSERELKDDFNIEDKAVSKTFKALIQKYDFITPKIGTGLFYSSATLNGFGVTTNDQDELIVTKNDIENNTAVTGVFLNLNFDIGSQFLEPLIQIGVDPTKEKPYLLLGCGISIPVSNFSISGGPIWTWEAQLSNLSLDDTVMSTSVLEEDIKYKFQSSPRGFYLGLNYSF